MDIIVLACWPFMFVDVKYTLKHWTIQVLFKSLFNVYMQPSKTDGKPLKINKSVLSVYTLKLQLSKTLYMHV